MAKQYILICHLSRIRILPGDSNGHLNPRPEFGDSAEAAHGRNSTCCGLNCVPLRDSYVEALTPQCDCT